MMQSRALGLILSLACAVGCLGSSEAKEAATPECRADQMLQKDSLKACMQACTITSDCKVVAYAESSKTCILMATTCQPPASIGKVTISRAQTKEKIKNEKGNEWNKIHRTRRATPDRTIKVFQEDGPNTCSPKGQVPNFKALNIAIAQCKQIALAVPEAKYYTWETKSTYCMLYVSCALEPGKVNVQIGTIGDVPVPQVGDVPVPGVAGIDDGEIMLVLLDNDQKPIPNLPLDIRNDLGVSVLKTRSTNQGVATVVLPKGSYVVAPTFAEGTGPAPPNDVSPFTVKPGDNKGAIAKFNMDWRVSQEILIADNNAKPFADTKVAVYDGKNKLVENLTTDAKGVLAVNLVPGQYVFKPAYPTDRKPANGNGDLKVTVDSGKEKLTDIIIPVNTPKPVVEKITITVTLVDAGGVGLPNIPVGLWDMNNKLISATSTDDKGVATFTVLPGEYIVRPVYPAERQPSEGDGTFNITVGPDNKTDLILDTKVPALDINGGGSNGGSVELTLLDQGGDFLPGLPVDIYSTQGEFITTLTTSETGTLNITQTPGSYLFVPEYKDGCKPPKNQAAFTIKIDPAKEKEMKYTTGVPAGCGGPVPVDTTATMDITVVDKDGVPLAYTEIGVYNTEGELLQSYVTDDTGTFTLEIPAGEYVIVPFYPDDIKPTEGEGSFTVDVASGVNPDKVLEANFSFAAEEVSTGGNPGPDRDWPGQVLGSIYTDENENNMLDAGEGIEGIEVKLLDDKNRVFAKTKTDTKGNYAFRDLVPGTYVVYIAPTKATSAMGSKPVTKKLNVQTNSTSRFDLRLLGSLNPTSGRLITLAYVDSNSNSQQDAGEQLIVGAPVILYDESNKEVARAMTDESGTATMEDVPFGLYSIKLDLAGLPQYGTPYVAGRVEMKTSTLRIAFTIQS